MSEDNRPIHVWVECPARFDTIICWNCAMMNNKEDVQARGEIGHCGDVEPGGASLEDLESIRYSHKFDMVDGEDKVARCRFCSEEREMTSRIVGIGGVCETRKSLCAKDECRSPENHYGEGAVVRL